MAARPKSKLPFVAAGVLVLVTLLDFFLKDIIPDSSVRQLLMLAACNVLVALSLNIINGMTGQFSIGHAGFMAIGGYVSAVIIMRGPQEDPYRLFFILAVLCGASTAAVAGYLVGKPSLRLRGCGRPCGR